MHGHVNVRLVKMESILLAHILLHFPNQTPISMNRNDSIHRNSNLENPMGRI